MAHQSMDDLVKAIDKKQEAILRAHVNAIKEGLERDRILVRRKIASLRYNLEQAILIEAKLDGGILAIGLVLDPETPPPNGSEDSNGKVN